MLMEMGSSPTFMVRSGNSPTGSGGTSRIDSTIFCSALPPVLVAVTVTVAMPALWPVMVTFEPETETVAAPSSEDDAV